MLEHAKVVWVIRTFLWEIRGTRLISYVGACKSCLSAQDIPYEKSEALDLPTILEHAKIIWVIRTYLLRIRACLDTSILKSRLPNYSASVNSQGMAKTKAKVVFGCTWLRLSMWQFPAFALYTSLMITAHTHYIDTTFNIPLLTLAIICPEKAPKTLHLMTLHTAAGQMLMMWLSCASSRNKRKEEISLVQAGKAKGKFFLCANVLAIWETMFQLQFCAEFAKDMLCHPELLMHAYRRRVQFCEPSLTS